MTGSTDDVGGAVPAGGVEVRVTAVVVHGGGLLLVRQPVTRSRGWSLPGGTWEPGESLADACAREVREETGLRVIVGDLLYVAEVPDREPPLLHLTFRCDLVGDAGDASPGTDEARQITDVRFVPVSELRAMGFSARFADLAEQGFPDGGAYVGPKSAIGL